MAHSLKIQFERRHHQCKSSTDYFNTPPYSHFLKRKRRLEICYFKTAVRLLYFSLARNKAAAKTTFFYMPLAASALESDSQSIIILEVNIYPFHILQDFQPLLYHNLFDIFRLSESNMSNYLYWHNQIKLYMQILIHHIRLCILYIRPCYKVFFL